MTDSVRHGALQVDHAEVVWFDALKDRRLLEHLRLTFHIDTFADSAPNERALVHDTQRYLLLQVGHLRISNASGGMHAVNMGGLGEWNALRHRSELAVVALLERDEVVSEAESAVIG